ncbi:MAG TPA: acyl carrier protein [Gemmatimonadales bacterium]
MTRDEIRRAVLAAVSTVVPEAHPETLDSAAPLRDQVDIDSMDFINFVVALDEAVGVAVPEADYGRLTTIDACVAYLEDTLRKHPPA